MQPLSLGWQSWSPPTPMLLRLPRRDYAPIRELESTTSRLSKRPVTTINYWCTWYALGYWPSPEEIIRQAQLIRQHHLPITHILLDDGWRESWLPWVINSLRQLGFKIGLWYAPFTRHHSLPLPQNLDRLIRVYHLDLIKLDFLYRPYFLPSLYPNPSETLTSLFSHLTTSFPRLTTIGCGVPFSDAVGYLDVIRLSKDTALPYPVPRLLNKYFYSHRVTMLVDKYQAWSASKQFVPDPDVRMFSLDTPTTTTLWGKMSYQIKGVGDNLAKLDINQLANMRLWLKN